jgi:hypothetical protein
LQFPKATTPVIPKRRDQNRMSCQRTHPDKRERR